MAMFDSKEDIEHVAKSIDNAIIAENEYNLSVSSYIETKDAREKVGIIQLNAEITITVEKIKALRSSIDAIIEEIKG